MKPRRWTLLAPTILVLLLVALIAAVVLVPMGKAAFVILFAAGAPLVLSLAAVGYAWLGVALVLRRPVRRQPLEIVALLVLSIAAVPALVLGVMLTTSAGSLEPAKVLSIGLIAAGLFGCACVAIALAPRRGSLGQPVER